MLTQTNVRVYNDVTANKKGKQTASPTTLKLPFSLERASYDSIQYVIVQNNTNEVHTFP